MQNICLCIKIYLDLIMNINRYQKNRKNYIIVSSFQNIPYSLYLAQKIKQNILIITFDIKIKNFLLKIIKIKYKVIYLKINLPQISLNFFKKNFYYNHLNIFNFYKEIEIMRGKLVLTEISNIYTFGTAVAFQNMIVLTYLDFFKIYNLDYMEMNKILSDKNNNSEGSLFTNFTILKLKWFIYFLISNFFVKYKYNFWFNGKYLLYYQNKNFKNQVNLNCRKIFKENKFINFVDKLSKKKYLKNSIIIPISKSFSEENHIRNLKKILIKNRLYKKNKIILKLKNNISSYQRKSFYIKFKKIMYEKKINFLNSSLPLEFINIKPDYFVGFQTTFFRFANPKKKNFILMPKKNDYIHIIFKLHKNLLYKFNKKNKIIYY